MKFQLEKFVEIFESEMKSLSLETLKKGIKGIDVDSLPKTRKYLDKNIFRTTRGAFYVTDGGDKMVTMSEKTFETVYGKTIKEYHPNLLKKNPIRYEADIFDEDFVICHETKRINIAHPFNFKHEEIELIEDEKELYKYLLDEFVLKVICNGNEKVFNFLLDVISCYSHRKQSQIILILVGLGGTGKSKFGELISAILGQACKAMSDQVLSGQDMFNSIMVGTSVGVLEETNGKGENNYTDIQRTLKRLATSPFLTCRKMQTDAYEVMNIINFVIISNFLKDIKTDRRNFVIEPSTHRMEDKGFYKKITMIIQNQRIMQQFFNDLYNRNYNVWEREIPKTEVAEDLNTQQSSNITNDFLVDLYLSGNRKPQMHLGELFEKYQSYVTWLGKKKFDSKLSESIFRHQMRQILEKVEYHKANKAHYDTTNEGLEKVFKKIKISQEYIAEKKTEREHDVFEDDEENQTIVALKNENATLKTRIEELEMMVQKLQAQQQAEQQPEQKKQKIKKVTKKCSRDWDNLDV